MTTINKGHALIIGAGLSGLAAAHALLARNLTVTILEERDRVAEPWRARHPRLRLNIHRHFASLPGLPIPKVDGVFVRRDTVVGYLEDYARRLGVNIEFGTRVTGVERHATAWSVETNRGTRQCTNLIIATGRDRVTHVPDWPGKGSYRGELRHVAELGEVGQYAGRNVLLIGAGNSGSDALNHLSRVGTGQVWVSVRNGPAVVPTRLLGFPMHRMARLFSLLPPWALDPMFALTQRLAFGRLERFGLRSHTDGGGTRLVRDGIAFAIDDGFIGALKQGRFRVVPEVERFDREGVHLKGGDVLAPDVVICATGYRPGLEPLFGHMGVLDERGIPLHPMGERDARHPGLWFTGYRPVFPGYFHAAGLAARRIAQRVSEEAVQTGRSSSEAARAAARVDIA